MRTRRYDVWPPQLPSHTPRWKSPEFAEELRGWVESAVGRVSSMTQAKLRPWATVWRVEGAGGVWYAKQNCALQQFEAILMVELATWAGQLVVPVAAVDEARGFLLTADQGVVLGAATRPGDLDAWLRVVTAAARLQRAAASHADDMLAHGLTALPVAEAAAYVEARAEQAFLLTDARHLPGDAVTSLREALPEIRRWADDVASLGLPITLDHADLHANNVFDTELGLRFFDFADAVVSEPLGVLRIPLEILAEELSAGPSDPRLRRVADAYLEEWTALVPARELRRVLPAALRVSRAARIESWIRVTASMSPDELQAWGEAVPGWLRRIAEPAPVTWS